MSNPIVTVDNFARAETDRMFRDLQHVAGGVNVLNHSRQPTAIDAQTVIRMNRDTLYSMAVTDISAGATVTIPDARDRYVSVMIVNNDHFINDILHEPGDHELRVEVFDTPHVVVAARVLADSDDPADVAVANELQDQFKVTAASATPFQMPGYDEASFTATRQAILELSAHVGSFDGAFGTREEVDPVRHLIGTAAGWGGLPSSEATYQSVSGLPNAPHRVVVGEVPVDAFWSISLYNGAGYFEANPLGRYSVNSVTGTPNDDGTVTVHFGGDADLPNQLPIMDGWNYLIRLYRPRPEVLNGTWHFPTPQPV
jgi:hypothetical protein